MKHKEDIKLPLENQRFDFPETAVPEALRYIKNSIPADIFPRFRKGFSGFGMNNGSFSFGDVIEYVLTRTGPVHALISSWVASQRSTEKIMEIFENRRLISVKFLLDRMFPNTRPKIYDYIVRNFGVDSVRTTRTHVKFCVLYNESWFVVIETSANLNRNRRLESFRITEDKAFCMFFKEMFDNFFNMIAPKTNNEEAAISFPSKLDDLPDIVTGKTVASPSFDDLPDSGMISSKVSEFTFFDFSADDLVKSLKEINLERRF